MCLTWVFHVNIFWKYEQLKVHVRMYTENFPHIADQPFPTVEHIGYHRIPLPPAGAEPDNTIFFNIFQYLPVLSQITHFFSIFFNICRC